MTDPAPLSPAAQAVLDAGQKYQTQAWNDATRQRLQLGIAAALRAAALEIHSEEYETCGGASYALMIDVDDLLAIADELDGAQPTSENV